MAPNPMAVYIASSLKDFLAKASGFTLAQLKPVLGVALRLSALDALACVGAAVLFLLAAAAVWAALRAVGARLHAALCSRRLTSFGRWVCVTGASDGIGRELALAAAARGADVVLVGRSETKLRAVAAEVRAARGGAARAAVIVADLSSPPAGWAARVATELAAAVSDGGLGVLFNNAGVSYPGPLFLHELEARAPGRAAELLAVNCGAVVAMANAALPLMLARRRGAIVNTGSIAGELATGSPLLSVYAGTKAFVNAFSRSLALEYAGRGVLVQCQLPAFVATAMAKIRTPTTFAPSPKAYAAAALAAVGAGGTVVVPYWSHALQFAALALVPNWLLAPNLLSMHMGLRSRLIKKLDSEAKAQ